MKGFAELTEQEQMRIIGGKDSDVARFMELLGYGIGMIVKMIKDIRKGKKPTVEKGLYSPCMM